MSKVFENEVAVIPAEELNGVLQNNFRQYIQGDLKKEQEASFIRSKDTEIGISDYKEYTHDDPHYHDYITETNYVIRGKICMRIIDTGEDYVIEEGGVFSIPPHVKHVLKIKAGTRIIFVKTPSINDKHVLDFHELKLDEWYRDEDF